VRGRTLARTSDLRRGLQLGLERDRMPLTRSSWHYSCCDSFARRRIIASSTRDSLNA
jgi:hypothetical protein